MISFLQSKNILNGVRCSVIGANGFIGTNLCLKLVELGSIVTGVGRSSAPRPELCSIIKWIEGDFFAPDFSYDRVTCDADIVIHLVASLLPAASNMNIVKDASDNLISSIKLIESCKENNVKKILFASSGGTIYGPQVISPISEDATCNPICSYGISKLAIEKYLYLYKHLYHIDHTILRISNPYGPYQTAKNQGLVSTLINKALSGSPINIWGDGEAVRDYLYIDDLISAFILSMNPTPPNAPNIYNIGSGTGTSIKDVLFSVKKIHGSLPNTIFTEERDSDVQKNILNINNAHQYLKWTPQTTWEEGLNKTYLWLKNNTL